MPKVVDSGNGPDRSRVSQQIAFQRRCHRLSGSILDRAVAILASSFLTAECAHGLPSRGHLVDIDQRTLGRGQPVEEGEQARHHLVEVARAPRHRSRRLRTGPVPPAGSRRWGRPFRGPRSGWRGASSSSPLVTTRGARVLRAVVSRGRQRSGSGSRLSTFARATAARICILERRLRLRRRARRTSGLPSVSRISRRTCSLVIFIESLNWRRWKA